MSTFGTVVYDAMSKGKRDAFKEEFEKLEGKILSRLDDVLGSIDDHKRLAIQALQVAHSWVSKSIRDDQLARNAKAEKEAKRAAE